MWSHGCREENKVLPERCGIRIITFAAAQPSQANEPNFSRSLKIAETIPLLIARNKGMFSASSWVALPALPLRNACQCMCLGELP